MKDDPIQPRLYLDDLTIGQEFTSGTHQIDADQIIEFATRFDPQPFHTDPEAARDTFFQGLAASGWHTMAITMRLLVESMPFAQGIIGAGGEISWPRPTRPGDILRATSRITDIRPSRSKPDRGQVMTQCLTLNQSDAIVQEFKASLLVFRKGA